MYVETQVACKKVKATVNTRADTICTTKKLMDEIGLLFRKEKGYVKGVNVKSLPIYGVARVARVTDIKIKPWRGKIDMTAAPLDD